MGDKKREGEREREGGELGLACKNKSIFNIKYEKRKKTTITKKKTELEPMYNFGT